MKMENKLVWKHFSFGNSFCESLDIRFEFFFSSSSSCFFFLCRTIRTNEVIDPWRYKCDSVTLYGERISMVHMYLQSKSRKFRSRLTYAVVSLLLISAYGYRRRQTSWSSREKSSENHFSVRLFFCMLWRSVWRTVLVERHLFKQKLRISWSPSFEK